MVTAGHRQGDQGFDPRGAYGCEGQGRHGPHCLALKGKKVNMEIKMVYDMVVFLGEE